VIIKMNHKKVKNTKSPFFSKDAWMYFIGLFNGQYKKLIVSTFGSALQALLIIPVILLIRFAFDEILPQKDIKLLIYAGIAILILRLINSLLAIWLRDVHLKIINNSIFQLRNNLFAKLYTLSRNFHTSHDPKILHTQIVVDTERLSNMSNAIVSRIFPALIISLGLTVILIFLNWQLMLIILILVPLLFLSNRYAGKILKNRVFIFQRAFETFSKGAFFILRFMDLTVIQSNQQRELERQRKALEDLQKKTNKMAILYTINSNVQNALTGFIGIIIIILGGMAVITEKMTLGDFLSFYVAAGYLNGFVNSLTSSIPDIISGNESLITLYKLANAQDKLPYSGSKRIEFNGAICLRSVGFKYTDQPVLENINLEILPRTTYAIFGPNSAGKTTIINLILGFYKPDKGEISAEGVLYEELDLSFLRQSFGVVMQHAPLFSGTIKENILYGIENQDDEQMIKASELALADHFIKKLPDGYETEIGEEGVLLSGGERQRIAIARALVRNPKMLILDEPTNHLDQQVIKEIMANLENLVERPTVLLISHDMNVVNFAQKIYKLENGCLKDLSLN